jgi:uncharacterized membrane protein
MRSQAARFQDRPVLSRPLPFALVVGALGFVAALAPSMVPRGELLQGVVAGLGFVIGYGVGAAVVSVARLLELLPAASPGGSRTSVWPAAIALAIIIFGLFKVADWQDGVRAAMQMEPVETFRPIIVALVALVVALLLILIGRSFRRAWFIFSNFMLVVLPERAALLAGLVAASLLFWSIGSGVLMRGLVDGLDASYAKIDALIPADTSPPVSRLKSGSSASLVSWSSLGAQGREHMLAAPSGAEISDLTGRPALEPIRVYAGVNSAADPVQRARLALEELKRTGAFERGTIVIATPTGTGWVDPAATAPLEYLLRGDVATVSVQYSYLPSWLSLFVEPERGAETAREVFRAVYGHWAALPPDRRPRLFLFGLSLGALNSDLSVDVYDILAAPFNGALWAGPPFPSRTWNAVVKARDPATPVWQPRYSDGRMFRFTTQENTLADGHAPWGPLRIVYLQYPSDPIVFFEPASLIHRPRIAMEPRPRDVSPNLSWVPFVSYVQMAVDMVTAAGTPRGFGHVYSAEHYLNGWIALTDPEDWTDQDLDRLRQKLRDEGL